MARESKRKATRSRRPKLRRYPFDAWAWATMRPLTRPDPNYRDYDRLGLLPIFASLFIAIRNWEQLLAIPLWQFDARLVSCLHVDDRLGGITYAPVRADLRAGADGRNEVKERGGLSEAIRMKGKQVREKCQKKCPGSVFSQPLSGPGSGIEQATFLPH